MINNKFKILVFLFLSISLINTYSIANEEFNVKGEPSGCVSLAAVLSNKINIKGKNVLVTISGGNVDADSFDKYIASV